MPLKTIYLTGAPASGKTTASRRLVDSTKNIELWDYSRRLMDYVNEKQSNTHTHKQLREQSSNIITATDIVEVDNRLIDFVSARRAINHIIIDSHPVTKEVYGFRCTAFSTDQIVRINPDEIWVMYADPLTTMARFSNDADGRQPVDAETARMHTFLQASVALNYGITVGRPVYFFDTNTSQDELVRRLKVRLS